MFTQLVSIDQWKISLTQQKLSLFHLNDWMILALLVWKWIALILIKEHLWRCWICFSLLNWIVAITLFLLLTPSPPSLHAFYAFYLCLHSFLPNLCYAGCSATYVVDPNSKTRQNTTNKKHEQKTYFLMFVLLKNIQWPENAVSEIEPLLSFELL